MCFVREGRVRGCQVACLVGGPSQNWGMHPEPRRRSRHSRGERDVLAGGAGQNMISFSFPACGRGNSARLALPGESVGRKGMGYPTGDFPPPKPSPRGEGAPVRTLGRMRGRSRTQPFLVEKGQSTGCRLNGIFLLPRWATRSPPHPSPPVTASPQGEAFAGGMPLQQNAFAPNPCSRKMRIQIRARTWVTK